MKRVGRLGSLVLGAAAYAASATAGAVTLSILPELSAQRVGSSFELRVNAGDLEGERIGAFDFSLSFDPAVISLDGIDFGNGLDGPADSLQSVDDSSAGAGVVTVTETSLGALLGQDGLTDFALAVLRFDALAPGTTLVELSPGIDPDDGFLGDEFGNPLDVVTASATVNVFRPVVASEASSWILVLVGAAVASLRRRGTGARRRWPPA